MPSLSVTALWLAGIAVTIHIALGAVQSDTFNSMLAKFSIPAIPAKAFPYIGVLLGLGGGVISGLQQGETLNYAAATAFLALVTGGAAAMHVESLRTALPAKTEVRK